jgi:hypothetical protein
VRDGQQAACPSGAFDNDVWTDPDLEPSLVLTSIAILTWWIASLLLGPIALAFRRNGSARSHSWWPEEDGP